MQRLLLLGCVLVVVTLSTGCSGNADEPAPAAATTSQTPFFVDTFDRLDEVRWTTGVPHQLGRSRIDPANVEVEPGILRLGLSAGALDGAELKTQGVVPRAVYRTRLMAAKAPDSVTGFFLYSPPDLAQEVDIELYNRADGTVRLTTYDAGKMTATRELTLGFDPTAGYHDYAIALTDAGVEFYADDVLLQAWSAGVPTTPMNLYLNVWYPQWLGGVPTPDSQATTVQMVSVLPR
ncbi:glycoside hydrolase family 16 protein [Actinomycetospora atypica]|uniref:Glycoside hydrolase family 16 protein n=1 Tax=Actinomycetospora atypica TaxID=1290095 RepID=A0ABV9YJ65_9PSEU